MDKQVTKRIQSGPTSKGLRRSLKKFARVLRLKPLYQEERADVFSERWSAIESRLSANDKTLLDIGCNMGSFTAAAARRGMVAIGFDPMEEAVSRARRQYAKLPGCGFVWLDVNKETVSSLPGADVILCLSVHHYWSRAHGEDGAWNLIRQLVDKSGKLFFEPASSHVRYGEEVPEFVENDAFSIENYVRKRFQIIAPGHKVELVKSTASINQEAFRSMYVVNRA